MHSAKQTRKQTSQQTSQQTPKQTLGKLPAAAFGTLTLPRLSPEVIAGVAVQPGDLVIADEVGVCFIPFARAAEVLAAAQKIGVAEEARMQLLERGMSIAEFVKLSPSLQGKL